MYVVWTHKDGGPVAFNLAHITSVWRGKGNVAVICVNDPVDDGSVPFEIMETWEEVCEHLRMFNRFTVGLDKLPGTIGD